MLRSVLLLWTRLACFACVAGLLAAAMTVLTGVDGWLMYETGREVAIEIGARILIALCFGLLTATAGTLLSLPYALRRPTLVQERCDRLNRIAAVLTLLVAGSTILGVVLRWALAVGLLELSNQSYIVLWSCLSATLVVAVMAWQLTGRTGAIATASAAAKLSSRPTRRLLLATALGAVLTAFSNRLAPRTLPRGPTVPRLKPGTPNLLLVTFDALCAEDMSLYGYPLPTTPNIDAFARSSAVFSNYYASSTFTTPCVVSMLTGRYPSDTHVYHYGGRLHGSAAGQTLPNVLRAAGYTTAASVANPGAHPGCLGFGRDFDLLPPPPIEDFASREAASEFHSATLASDAGFAARIGPYLLEQVSPQWFGRTRSTFPPVLSFTQAEALLEQMTGPFFLWVHVYAPHFPYLPDSPYLKSFLKTDELRTHTDFAKLFNLKGYNYTAEKQPWVDKARLRYDEWIAEADHEFGRFMEKIRNSGRLDDTAIVVAADHGESFKGGYVGHGGPRQLRPVLHVPLMIHLPGQTGSIELSQVADHTSIAPTLLDIAGIARPPWMNGGPSLEGLLHGAPQTTATVAFTQYFESNSAFKPINRGTIGAIDGRYQYLLNVETRTATLYALGEAHEQKVNLAASEPAVAARLHATLTQRFPELTGT